MTTLEHRTFSIAALQNMFSPSVLLEYENILGIQATTILLQAYYGTEMNCKSLLLQVPPKITFQRGAIMFHRDQMHLQCKTGKHIYSQHYMFVLAIHQQKNHGTMASHYINASSKMPLVTFT